MVKVIINNVEYEYLDRIADNERIRTSFMELISSTFGFDFKEWQKAGLWTEKYEPHVLVKEDQVVATVTVNHMKYRYHGEKNYIQLGGVLTRKEYRKRDLGRWLMEHIIERYQTQCDQIFLLCNDSAIDFYPKFGFKKAVEYVAHYAWSTDDNKVHKNKARKLNIEVKEDRELLLECYKKSNPFSRFPSVECEELLLFYAMGFRKDCMYYFEELGVVMFAKFRKSGLTIEDIYGDLPMDSNKMQTMKSMLHEVLLMNAHENEQVDIKLGFTPVEELDEFTILPLVEKDDTLYLLENKENVFEGDRLRFPILSHN